MLDGRSPGDDPAETLRVRRRQGAPPCRLFKAVWGDRVATVFPRQGHYAHDPENVGKYRKPDVTVEGIGDLLEMDIERLVKAG